jgi:uncharacterized coiled-coil protein SlyX
MEPEEPTQAIVLSGKDMYATLAQMTQSSSNNVNAIANALLENYEFEPNEEAELRQKLQLIPSLYEPIIVSAAKYIVQMEYQHDQEANKLKNLVTTQENHIGWLEDDLAKTKVLVEKQTQRVDKLSRQITQTQQLVERLEQDKQQSKKESEDLRAKIGELEQTKLDMQNKVTGYIQEREKQFDEKAQQEIALLKLERDDESREKQQWVESYNALKNDNESKLTQLQKSYEEAVQLERLEHGKREEEIKRQAVTQLQQQQEEQQQQLVIQQNRQAGTEKQAVEKLTEARGVLTQLTTDKTLLTNQANDLKSEVENRDRQIKELYAQGERLAQQANEIQRASQDKDSTITQLQQRIMDDEKVKNQLREQVERNQQAITNYVQEINQKQQSLTQMEIRLQGAEAQALVLSGGEQRVYDEIQKDLVAAGEKLAAEEKRGRELVLVRDVLDNRAKALQQKTEEDAKKLQELSESVVSQKSAVQKLNSNVELIQDKLKESQNKATTLQNSLNESERLLKQYRQKETETTKKISELTAELQQASSFKTKAGELKESAAKTQTDMRQVQDELREAKLQLTEVQRLYDEESKLRESLAQQSGQTVNELSQKLQTKIEEAETLRKRGEELNQRLDEVAKTQQQDQVMHAQDEKQQQEFEQLLTEKSTLELRLKELESRQQLEKQQCDKQQRGSQYIIYRYNQQDPTKLSVVRLDELKDYDDKDYAFVLFNATERYGAMQKTAFGQRVKKLQFDATRNYDLTPVDERLVNYATPDNYRVVTWLSLQQAQRKLAGQAGGDGGDVVIRDGQLIGLSGRFTQAAYDLQSDLRAQVAHRVGQGSYEVTLSYFFTQVQGVWEQRNLKLVFSGVNEFNVNGRPALVIDFHRHWQHPKARGQRICLFCQDQDNDTIRSTGRLEFVIDRGVDSWLYPTKAKITYNMDVKIEPYSIVDDIYDRESVVEDKRAILYVQNRMYGFYDMSMLIIYID